MNTATEAPPVPAGELDVFHEHHEARLAAERDRDAARSRVEAARDAAARAEWFAAHHAAEIAREVGAQCSPLPDAGERSSLAGGMRRAMPPADEYPQLALSSRDRYKLFANYLDRLRDNEQAIEAAQAELEDAEAELEDAEGALDELAQARPDVDGGALDAAREELHRLEGDRDAVAVALESAHGELDKSEARAAAIAADLDALAADAALGEDSEALEKARAEHAAARAEAERYQSAVRGLQARLEKAEAAVVEHRAKVDALATEVHRDELDAAERGLLAVLRRAGKAVVKINDVRAALNSVAPEDVSYSPLRLQLEEPSLYSDAAAEISEALHQVTGIALRP